MKIPGTAFDCGSRYFYSSVKFLYSCSTNLTKGGNASSGIRAIARISRDFASSPTSIRSKIAASSSDLESGVKGSPTPVRSQISFTPKMRQISLIVRSLGSRWPISIIAM
nr:MAG TPA: hypothetical protein [Caudoviricetes sp.]DAZ07077.1 MAG TPA: hypothetical protein [Caudoviricetes sp.]